MRFKMDFSKLPKCGAHPKKNSSRTHPCRHIALENGRCYYHQGRRPRHGHYTNKAHKEQLLRRLFIDETRTSLGFLNDMINRE